MSVKFLPILLSVFFFSSFFCSEVDLSTHFIRTERNPDMYAAQLRSRTKPGYVRSLSYDPVEFGQECGRANLTLAFSQFQRLLVSMSTSELVASSHTLQKFSPGGDGGSGRRPLPPDHLTFW